ncbi:MAG TPA: LPS export ABC transporter periplasmic protein LptC [Bacillota bacterium]|nr:LPS export ABC transporter periplasmic protein LptC [Bacillota bacterium]
MRTWRLPVALAVLLLLIGVAGWWWGRERAAPVLKRILPGQPGTTMFHTTLIWWEKGKRAGEIRARKVWRSKDGNIAVLEDISNSKLFYDDNEIILDAPLAKLDQGKQIVIVSGGIKARFKEGIFETESLRMDRLRQTLVSDGKVSFRYKETTVTADLLRGDLEKEVFWLVGNVVVQEGSQVLRGEELEYSLKDETYSLLGRTEVELEL